MIIKEYEYTNHKNQNWQNGENAEKDMAFYLKHKYYSDENIFIINDFCFHTNYGYAQIDHLIITPKVFIIVETKNVQIAIKYNKYEEWCRFYNNEWHGTSNPVKQASRQACALQKLITDKNNELKKKFGIELTKFKIEILVAISDSGKIKRPSNDIYRNIVYKTDLIVEKIDSIIKESACNEFIVNSKDTRGFATFLHEQHISNKIDNTIKCLSCGKAMSKGNL